MSSSKIFYIIYIVRKRRVGRDLKSIIHETDFFSKKIFGQRI